MGVRIEGLEFGLNEISLILAAIELGVLQGERPSNSAVIACSKIGTRPGFSTLLKLANKRLFYSVWDKNCQKYVFQITDLGISVFKKVWEQE